MIKEKLEEKSLLMFCPKKNIALTRYIIESHEGYALVSTKNNDESIIEIRFAACNEKYVKALTDSLIKKFSLKYIS